MATQVITENTYLAGARNSLKKEDCMELYEKWAASYNEDLADASQNYIAPLLVAQAALASSKDADAFVLDAGCGTGLVAEALAKGSNMTIDGMDLSPAMLKVAEQTGVYQNLFKVDLTQPIDQPDQKYDIVTCCGTFTRGHVGPDPALREFIRLLKPNGIVVATVLEEIWVSGGYKAEADKLEAAGLAKVISRDLIDYRKGAGDKATLLLLQRTGSA
ncbi:S-adenosyl-L-methionine-dependent methyltransferase [Aspergillus bertholletiae]|uniref:S-adenosyl-L-methionine-dependent methyltransferase n=1 Tax=Aspergillus bertholletiae TaxID=1226010 RepID=A0A5N7BMW2_9EURO|nr:S-adenosyl-L-methionine-dependent methyltransferase [Aspergillus bertholletiae]